MSTDAKAHKDKEKEKKRKKEERKAKEPYNNKFAPPEFIRLLKRTKEMREFSEMSISQLWNAATFQEFQVIEEDRDRDLLPDDEFGQNLYQKTKEEYPEQKHLRSEVLISEEPDKTDFFMVLEGNCYINVKVKITFDQSDSLRYIPQKEGVPEHSVASGADDEYARKHHSIPDTFTAKFLLPRFAIINDETVSKYYIDFHQLFQENPNLIGTSSK